MVSKILGRLTTMGKGKSVIHAKVEKEKEEEVEDKGKDHE